MCLISWLEKRADTASVTERHRMIVSFRFVCGSTHAAGGFDVCVLYSAENTSSFFACSTTQPSGELW
jgi:hypothetical protein